MLLEGRNIAVVEDEPVMGESLLQSLALEGAKVSLYQSGQAALKCVSPRSVDLVVCDIRLPDTDGPSLFRRLGFNADAPPFLFVTAFGDIDAAVELMREGAADYLTKPFDMDVFLQRVKGSLRPSQAKAEGTTLGVPPAMRDIEHLLRIVARSDTPVLITGETGTGKDVCARFLHQLAEKNGPFMAVNCAAIPRDLLESELFGHEAGAFTGASKRHLGFAERAGEGTLFLDEIGELALPLQAKLLRLLEDRKFYRVGGETSVTFKARLRGVSAHAEQAALTHPWPGNVREMRNRLERAIALNLSGWISPQDLFPEKHLTPGAASQSSWSLADTREAAERQRIVAVLAECRGRIGKTAEMLGVSRTTLWEKMKRYGLPES